MCWTFFRSKELSATPPKEVCGCTMSTDIFPPQEGIRECVESETAKCDVFTSVFTSQLEIH